MATIRNEIFIDAPVEDVWAALRDFHALADLAPGFIAGSRRDGEDRIVTFGNGAEVRETPVSIDDEHRRLVWTIVDGPYTHHNGASQVFEENGGTRFVWTADLLPDGAAETTSQMMGMGTETIKKTMEAKAAAG